jgi:hypothetical protein
MTKKDRSDPNKVLDETATSIRNLVFDLEIREREGRPVTATEIQTMASRLQVHVEDILAALESLRDKKFRG